MLLFKQKKEKVIEHIFVIWLYKIKINIIRGCIQKSFEHTNPVYINDILSGMKYNNNIDTSFVKQNNTVNLWKSPTNY